MRRLLALTAAAALALTLAGCGAPEPSPIDRCVEDFVSLDYGTRSEAREVCETVLREDPERFLEVYG